MNVSMSCQLCDGDPRFCPCHKTNQMGVNSMQNSHKPTKKKKDMIHCTICHMPKAKHECSLVPCLDPLHCGKPRLHRKQGNRGYHDTIVTTIFTPETNNDQSPTKKRQRATEIPGNWARQCSYLDVNGMHLESVVAPHGEEERTREFIVSLSDFIINWDPSFASVEGRMLSLKLAAMTHTQMLGMKRTMKTKFPSKDKKSDSSSYEDGDEDEKEGENHLVVLHHDTFEEHDQSHVFAKEENDDEEAISDEVVAEHSLTGYNLSSQGLIYETGDT